MPAWTIHVALARKLKPNDDLFALGSILPDVLDGYLFPPSHIISKNTSHYRVEKKIHPTSFLEANQYNLDNPVVLGYLAHLLTDSFYNEYTANHHFIKTETKTLIILNNQKAIPKTPNTLILKQREFAKYGHKLGQLGLLGKPLTISPQTSQYLQDLPFDYTKEDIDMAVRIINSLINTPSPQNIPYELFTEEELDHVYNECYQYLEDYFRKIKNRSHIKH